MTSPMQVVHISPYLGPHHSDVNGTGRILAMLLRARTGFSQHFLSCGRLKAGRLYQAYTPRLQAQASACRMVTIDVKDYQFRTSADQVLHHAEEYAHGAARYLRDSGVTPGETLFLAHGCEALIFAAILKDTMARARWAGGAWCLQTHFWLPAYMRALARIDCSPSWKPPVEDLSRRCALVEDVLSCMDAVFVENRSMLQDQAFQHLRVGETIFVQPLVAVDRAFRLATTRADPRAVTSVVSVGRCSVEKGHHTVLDGFRRLLVTRLPKSPRIALRIVANSRQGMEYPHQRSYREALRTEAMKSHPDKISVESGLRTVEYARMLRAADVVVMASTYEPFGMVALEAYSCGARLVLSKDVGCLDLLDGQVSVVRFDPGSEHECNAALDAALELPRPSLEVGGSACRGWLGSWGEDRLVRALGDRLEWAKSTVR